MDAGLITEEQAEQLEDFNPRHGRGHRGHGHGNGPRGGNAPAEAPGARRLNELTYVTRITHPFQVIHPPSLESLADAARLFLI